MYDDKVFGGGGSGSSDIVEISNTEISEGDAIESSIYYYQPSSSPSGEDTKNEKLFLQNSLGKAVEVGFLSKDTQSVTLSRNSIMLSANESFTITATAEGVITAKSLDNNAATVTVNNSNVVITGLWSGSAMSTKIIVTARSTQTKMSNTVVIDVLKNTIELGTEPSFNADNFAPLDTTGTRQYYFGQYGNAFYGYQDGTQQILVDTDCKINNSNIYTAITKTEERRYPDQGFFIVDNCSAYINNLKSTFFNSYDILATTDRLFIQYLNNTNINSAIRTNSSGTVYAGSYTITGNNGAMGSGTYYYISTNGTISSASISGFTYNTYDSNSYRHPSYYIAPAFNLDLAKVLLPKSALSDSTLTSPTDISVKVSEDNKFLINAGSAKSDFTINSAGLYSVSSIASVNSGTNYISFIIYDPDGISIFYGNIEELTQTSGSIDMSVITSLLASSDPGVYTLAVFQEEKCDAYKTDYASAPCYFSFTVG